MNSTINQESSSSPGSSTTQPTIRSADTMIISSSSPTRESPISHRLSIASSTLSVPTRRGSSVTSQSISRRDSTFSTTSALSLAQSRITSTTSTFQASVVDKEGNIGLVLDRPEPSMLVFYLKQTKRSVETYSFLGIESTFFISLLHSIPLPFVASYKQNTYFSPVDEDTKIKTSACDCRHQNNSCRRTVIQQSGTSTLLSHRTEPTTDLDSWNLAALGQSQRKSLPESKERLRWVAVDFPTVDAKEKFVTMFNSLATILRKEIEAYYGNLKNLTT